MISISLVSESKEAKAAAILAKWLSIAFPKQLSLTPDKSPSWLCLGLAVVVGG